MDAIFMIASFQDIQCTRTASELNSRCLPIYLYQIDRSIVNYGVSSLIYTYHFYSILGKIPISFANRVNPDQTSQKRRLIRV